MPRSPIAQFTGKDGCLYLVNLKSDGRVYGPYLDTKQVRMARATIPGHERSNDVVRAFRDGLPAEEADVNPLTR
jgi:hypothetical protein